MQNNGFYIKSVIATGIGVKLSRVDFSNGCNLLFGPSEKGKSSVFSVINFLLGDDDDPKAVKESEGYDTYYMEYSTLGDGKRYTVRRKIGEKQLLVKECAFEMFESVGVKGQPYSMTGKKGVPDYSQYLMGLNGFPEGLELKSSVSRKVSFKFTKIRNLILANENRIVSEKPIFNPDNDTSVRQQEKSVIYYLTSGTDDSGFPVIEEDKVRKARYKGKIEVTLENIDAAEARLRDLGDTDYSEFRDAGIVEVMQKSLLKEEESLNQLYEKRRALEDEKRKAMSKALFLKEFVSRMRMLERHYRTDVERFEYLFEGASLFSLLTENRECPLCHSAITDETVIDEGYKEAIQEESNVLQSKLNDIQKLIIQKEEQLSKTEGQIEECNLQLEEINGKVNGFATQLASMRSLLARYQEHLEKKAEVKFLTEQVRRLYQELSILKQEEKTKPQTEKYIRTTDINEEFCDMLKEKLVDWNIIGENDAVVFDEDGFDFVLGGKKRLTCGKGARGVTCSAILMTLLEFCDRKEIPFSKLLVLDSPITAHFDSERMTAEETTQSRFFAYCNDHVTDYQLILIDNKSPNVEERQRLTNINYIEFSEDGRNGFYLGKE